MSYVTYDNRTRQPNLILLKRGVIKDTTWENYASGEFTPGRGFDMVKTKYGSLNISLYAIARYLNQCRDIKPGRII